MHLAKLSVILNQRQRLLVEHIDLFFHGLLNSVRLFAVPFGLCYCSIDHFLLGDFQVNYLVRFNHILLEVDRRFDRVRETANDIGVGFRLGGNQTVDQDLHYRFKLDNLAFFVCSLELLAKLRTFILLSLDQIRD